MTIKANKESGTNKAAATRHRLQLDFSPEAYERLLRIRELSDAATNAEVVRNALRLYDWFLEQKRDEARLQVVQGDSVKEVEVLF